MYYKSSTHKLPVSSIFSFKLSMMVLIIFSAWPLVWGYATEVLECRIPYVMQKSLNDCTSNCLPLSVIRSWSAESHTFGQAKPTDHLLPYKSSALELGNSGQMCRFHHFVK